jgi:predicted phage terminase large subunit-like protein
VTSSLVQELALCDRETGLSGSFKSFVELAWPHVYPSSPFQDNWHIGLICEHYEAVFKGEISELVINLPPGGSKSSLTCVMLPAWGWIRRPGSSWIFAAYGQKLVRRDAGAWLGLIKSKWWQSRWGDRFGIPTVPAIDLIKNDKTGFRLGTTPGGEVTGFHANYQVIDDPNKPEELTKVMLEETKSWMSRTMSSRWRRPPEINGLILIMQRLHSDDLSSELIERGATHVCLPANFDPARRTETAYGKDPRMRRGDLLDPVRLPQNLIDKLKKHLGPMNAAAQLQQAPVPEGGAIFKRDSFKFWRALPPQFDQLICSWDCAFKDEADSDLVCGGVWGRVGATFYLLDIILDHLDFGGTVKSIVRLAARWPSATTKLIEDKANGPAVVQTLEKALPGIVAVDPRGGKHSRASACSGFFEAGNVYLPDPEMPGYAWVNDYMVEMCTFPRGKHDDQVDMTTQALLYLQEHTSYLKSAMDEVRKWMGYIET